MAKLKIFISYASENKHLVGEIKRCLEEYEDTIDCFVAHDDILPGTEWEKMIFSRLNQLKAEKLTLQN